MPFRFLKCGIMWYTFPNNSFHNELCHVNLLGKEFNSASLDRRYMISLILRFDSQYICMIMLLLTRKTDGWADGRANRQPGGQAARHWGWHASTAQHIMHIWVRSRRCGCLVTWFCYHLKAKPVNKTATPSWPDPYNEADLCKPWIFMFYMYLPYQFVIRQEPCLSKTTANKNKKKYNVHLCLFYENHNWVGLRKHIQVISTYA